MILQCAGNLLKQIRKKSAEGPTVRNFQNSFPFLEFFGVCSVAKPKENDYFNIKCGNCFKKHWNYAWDEHNEPYAC